MSLFSGRKLKVLSAIFIINSIFLLSSDLQPAQAYHATSSYNKLFNDTLTSDNWNDLFDDFVNTWLPTSLNGPVGIATSSPVSGLEVNGIIRGSSLFSSGNVGFGINSPTARLEVVPASGYSILAGSMKVGNIALPTTDADAATKGYVDSFVAAATSTFSGMPAGTSGQTLRHDGADWVANSILFNNGTNVGIGITNPVTRLDVLGSGSNSAIKAGGLEFSSFNVNNSWIGENTYYNSSIHVYRNNGYASQIYFINGKISFYTAPSGVAGNNIGAAERLTILNTGNVGIGTSAPLAKLEVVPASGYAVLAGNYKIGNVAIPTLDSDAATKGYVDSFVAAATSTFSGMPAGTSGQTLRHDGADWVGNSLLFNDGTNVGIGTTTPGAKLSILGGEGTYVAPNFGSANLGAINILNSTSDRRNGITFSSAGSSNAQAGIYAHQDNSVGTHMYLATTNNYATGPQARLTILNTGNVGIGTTVPAAKLEVSSAGGTGSGINLRLTSASSYIPIDFNTPAGLGGQFILTGSSFSNGAFGSNELALASELTAGVLHLASIGSSGVIRFTAGGNTTAYERMRITSIGNVGIGTSTPLARLSVVPASGYSILAGDFKIGNVALPTVDADAATKGYVDSVVADATSTLDTLPSGTSGQTLRHNGADWVGNSLLFNDGANVGIGTTVPGAALGVSGRISQLNTGQSVFLGENAGRVDDLTTNRNVFVGFDAGFSNTSGLYNVAVGALAMFGNVSGGGNIVLGHEALSSNQSGSYNIALGTSALFSNTGSANLAIGWQALNANTSGTNNVATGYSALSGNTIGTNNIASGYQSLYYNQTGSYNIALGARAGFGGAPSGSNIAANVIIGWQAGYNMITNANYNTILGHQAGDTLTSGASNIIIGYNADVPNPTGNSQLSIGNAIYGSLSTGNIGIGTSTPLARLSVVPASGYSILAGDFKIGNVALPTVDADAATKGYVDSVVADATSTLGALPSGTSGQTLRHDGADWVGNSLLHNDGTSVGLGTTTPLAKFNIYNDAVYTATTLAMLNNSNIAFRLKSRGSYNATLAIGSIGNTDAIGIQAFDPVANTAKNILLSPYGGNVGIGTANPTVKFDLVGATVHTSGAGQVKLSGANDGQNYGTGLELSSTRSWSLISANNQIGSRYTGTFNIVDVSSSTNRFTIDANGNVGVAIYKPFAKLNVVGSTYPGGVCPAGYNWYDFDNGGTVQDGECRVTIIAGLDNGNVGLGTTTPLARLEVIPASGYSILAGDFKIGNVALPTVDADAATKGYVDSVVADATSTLSSVWSGTKNGNIWNGDAGAGNVGIGTTTPSQKLELVGNLNINTSGDNALFSSYKGVGANGLNIWIGGGGQSSIASSTVPLAGSYNTALGYLSLFSNTTGYHNTAVGYVALTANTTGTYNSAFGIGALAANTTGTTNTAIGASSLAANTTGYENSAVGYQSLNDTTTGNRNTATGYLVMRRNTTGYLNAAFGLNALYNNISGANNSAFGSYAMNANITGTNNTAVGYMSLYANTSGAINSALGQYALSGNTSGNYNTGLGYYAGSFIANGATANSTSSYSVFLGSNTKSLAATDTNEIVIGYSAIGAGSNTVTLGSSTILTTILQGNVGIGTTTPLAKLSVVPASGYSILAGDYKIGNVALPTVDADAATKGYVDSVVADATSTLSSVWSGTKNGDIWNGDAGAGNVGIGTTTPSYKLDVDGSARFSGNIYQKLGANGNSISLLASGNGTTADRAILIGQSTDVTGIAAIGIGHGTKATSTGGVAIGYTASAASGIAISRAGQAAVTSSGIAIGGNSTTGIAIGGTQSSTGYLAIGGNASNSNSIAIGPSSVASGIFSLALGDRTVAAHSSSVAIGLGSKTSGANQFVSGGYFVPGTYAINEVYFGTGPQGDLSSTISGASYSINGSGGYGVDQNGGNISIVGGKGTGAGTPGNIYFSTANTSVSGSTLQSLSTKMSILYGGNVGIGTSTPLARLEVVPSSGYSILAGDYKIGNVALPTVDSDAATKGYVDALISTSTSDFLPLAGGTMAGAIDMGNNNISNINTLTVSKLTATTIDPLYNILGLNYSTFAPSIAGGVKEEYVGKVKISKKNSAGEYETIIDFSNIKSGSDLWVWRKVVDFNKDSVEAIITPYGRFAQVYYVVDGNKLIFRSDKSVEVSYRLIARRYDWRNWPTLSLDQETTGVIIK